MPRSRATSAQLCRWSPAPLTRSCSSPGCVPRRSVDPRRAPAAGCASDSPRLDRDNECLTLGRLAAILLRTPPRSRRKDCRVRQSHKTVLLWITLIFAFVVIWQFLNGQRAQENHVLFSQFVQEVDQHPERFKAGSAITIRKNQENAEFRGQYANNENFVTTGIVGEKLLEKMDKAKLGYEVVKENENGFWQQVFVTWLPMLVLVVLFLVFMRQLQVGGGKAMSFGKSKAKLLSENQRKMTFADVAGIEEAKDEVEEIIAFLKDPKKFTRLGGRIPKGVLMMGPPGTGKTLLARAIAGEAGVPFYSISGSDFVEMFVGVGASRVRDLFEQGKKNAPCIIFIDEIDAVGRHRGAGLGGGHDEREQTLNQLLVEMDGFESNDGVILIAATNRPDVLDPALLRPGRFDRQIVVDAPDLRGREGVLKVHLRNKPIAEDVNVTALAKGTPGMAGADLANLVNEAALLAVRRNHEKIFMADLEDAKDKVMLGAERKSLVMREEERRLTAYHEGGHAVCAMLVKGNDPLHKVTIVPRGRALGLAFTLPEDDRVSVTREQIEARLVMAYGGRAAEEIVFGRERVTTGAASDIQTATAIARRYVSQWGLSDTIGPVLVGDNEQEVFLGQQLTSRR